MAESVFGKPIDNAVKEIEEQVSELNSNLTTVTTGTLSPVISGGTLVDETLYKVGNTVWASARLYGLSTPASGVFFTVPNGFRPKRRTYVYAYMMVDDKPLPVFGRVDIDGSVNLTYTSSKTTTQVFFAGSWSVL